MKKCEICGKEFPTEDMSKSYKNRCKHCVADLTREKRANNSSSLEKLATMIDEHFKTTELDCVLVVGREEKNNMFACSAKRKDSMAVEIARAMTQSEDIREAIMFGSAIFFDYQERNKKNKI